MQEIQKFDEISDQKTLLYIHRDDCAPCKRMDPIIKEFEEKHPDIKVLTAKMSGRNLSQNPEDKPFFDIATLKGKTPSFAFIENKKPYVIFRSEHTLAQIEKYMALEGTIEPSTGNGDCEHARENVQLKEENAQLKLDKVFLQNLVNKLTDQSSKQ